MKKQLFLPTFATLATTIFLTPCATSAVLAQYNFEGISLSASTVASHVAANAVNFTGSSAGQFAFANLLAVNTAPGATTSATAVTNNSYFQFTLTPEVGYQASFSSLAFDATTGMSPTTQGFAIRSSVDGFASDVLSSLIATQFSSFTAYSADLSGSAFQNLNSATTYRIYVFSSGSNPGTAFDNVTLNGNVAVPEPSSALLLSLSTIVLILNRRRRII